MARYLKRGRSEAEQYEYDECVRHTVEMILDNIRQRGDDIFRTNWRGAFASVRAFKNLLAAGDGGTVVNISSVAAMTGIGSNVAYYASKAALDSMTRSLARASEIRVVSVSPCWVLGEYAGRMDPAYLQEQIDLTPLQRLVTASFLRRPYAFLRSP